MAHGTVFQRMPSSMEFFFKLNFGLNRNFDNEKHFRSNRTLADYIIFYWISKCVKDFWFTISFKNRIYSNRTSIKKTNLIFNRKIKFDTTHNQGSVWIEKSKVSQLDLGFYSETDLHKTKEKNPAVPTLDELGKIWIPDQN